MKCKIAKNIELLIKCRGTKNLHNFRMSMRKIRRKLFWVFLTVILLLLLGFIGVETPEFQSPTTTLTSSGSITYPQPYLHLVVSPLAFPIVGQFWEISVYSLDASSNDRVYYSLLPNATVLVTAKAGDQTNTYSMTSDELGHTKFQFLPEFSDIAFQATYGGNKSGNIAITQHFVPSETVDFMFDLSVVMSGITLVAETILFHFRKKVRVIFSLLIGIVFCLSLIQLVISTYVKLFLETAWGYPERIFGFLTWANLSYASLVGIILFAGLSLLSVLLSYRNPAQKNVPTT